MNGNRLVAYVQEVTEEMGLTKNQLVEKMGYRNINKGLRRLMTFEETGTTDPRIFRMLSDALGLDPERVAHLAQLDEEDRVKAWNKWADEPVPMRLVIRMIPGFYSTKTLGSEFTRETALQLAENTAKEERKQVCLIVSRRETIWVDEKGKVYAIDKGKPGRPSIPYMRTGKKKVWFCADSGTFKVAEA